MQLDTGALRVAAGGSSIVSVVVQAQLSVTLEIHVAVLAIAVNVIFYLFLDQSEAVPLSEAEPIIPLLGLS